MNDKRFTIVEDDDIILILDNETKKKIGFNSQVVNLLNELNEENNQLLQKLCRLEEAIEKRGYESIDDFW